jgi:carbonic anhydrase/acetyltransferase-like protein (isoleucine patch superfamily)
MKRNLLTNPICTMKKIISSSLCLFLALHALAQKTAYIPLFLLNKNDVNGAQYTTDKTYQTANFTCIWGNTVGTNPATYTADPSLAFNPVAILDTLERVYAYYKTLGFLDDSPGTNLAKYKIPVMMYGTFGTNGIQGFATGGSADNVIGAFSCHPTAMQDGKVAAHELTHALQFECTIDYRDPHGLGGAFNNAGIFYETHANFMRDLMYPSVVTAWGMDDFHIETLGDWKNIYEGYPYLNAIMEADGINMVNRLWRESTSSEYPLQTYKRLLGATQAQFNDKMYQYVRRMVTYDFSYKNIGTFFRAMRTSDLKNYLPTIQALYTILKQDPNDAKHFSVPIECAPEEFGYNIVPIYPDANNCVQVKFKGHSEVNTHTGWRYGFVAVKSTGLVSRYGDMASADSSIIQFSLASGETQLYFIVMGAPKDAITTNTTNDTWHGYPKKFRFPYDLNISGGVPEGFQTSANFRKQLKTNGAIHANGGGFVQNTATVASTVYVGPYAMVLGNSKVSGTVRIDNTALVQNSTLSGSAIVQDNAFVIDGSVLSANALVKGQAYVDKCTIYDNAVVDMRAHVSNYKLHGTIEVGGDVVVYNTSGDCGDAGVYYLMTNYYEDNLLQCDNRTASNASNSDVNKALVPFTAKQMTFTPTSCTITGIGEPSEVEAYTTVQCFPNPFTSGFHIRAKAPFEYSIYTASGQWMEEGKAGQDLVDAGGHLPSGLYVVKVRGDQGTTVVKIAKQ